MMVKANQYWSVGKVELGKLRQRKLIMQYLTYVGGRAAGDERTVEQQVLESNPLLEAFGNARTVRNDNSSRFGKFVEIQFDASGRISGAAIRTYLLERSRVVQITDPERNYHCFYQLCASGKDAEKYKLGHPSHFHYLNQSKVYELDGVSNAEEYMKTRTAMDIVGISHEDQEAIFRTLAAILHLGNIEFSPGKEHDSSVLKDQKSSFHMQMAANLFMCDMNLLLATLCTSRTIQTREGIIIKALDCNAAVSSRDALAKTVYARLFDWLVDKINTTVGQDLNSQIQIGVLDIYGFECFKDNSFEQFCINFANEKLQQHFNEHVFKMEQEEYSKEEIDWSYIEFIDNQDVLDLIEKHVPKINTSKFFNQVVSAFPGPPKNIAICCLLPNALLSLVFFCSVPEESSRSSYKFSSVATRFKADVLDNAVKRIQRQLRTFVARRDFVSTRAAALGLQAFCRGQLMPYSSAVCCKSGGSGCYSYTETCRRWLLKEAYMELYSAATVIQSNIRGFSIRQRFLHGKKHKAATFIQEDLASNSYFGLHDQIISESSSVEDVQGSLSFSTSPSFYCGNTKSLEAKNWQGGAPRLKQEANESGALTLS
ncbi:hypothetical protein GBA52_028350 [Prunus armeniaca]|nr:hypothetical protein GBA52_028350 [Prunus armeniaca]